MAASAQEKFNAAVKVIRGLPKHGSFQPSHELMLKFYAYYKQATEGPCTAPRPNMFSVVNRRKWDAWSELGEMPKEQAMLLYVDELKNVSKHVKDTLYRPEIVETMPQTEQVAEFVQTLGTFYELVEEGSVVESIKGVEGQNGSAVFNGGGEHNMNHSDIIGDMLENGREDRRPYDGADLVASNGIGANGLSEEEDESESEEENEEEKEDVGFQLKTSGHVDSGSDTDEFCDTSDQLIQMSVKNMANVSSQPLMETSTPMNAKREIRVRFAPHPEESQNGDTCLDYLNSNDRNSECLPVSSPQMRNDRLALGSVVGSVFVQEDTAVPCRSETDSLYVHGSCSSLVSLAGDSVIGDAIVASTDLQGTDLEEDTYDGRSISLDLNSSFRDPVKSRGGGEEDVTSRQRTNVTYTTGFGASWNAGESGRNPGQQAGDGGRRGFFPGGSGSGGQRGEGWNPAGKLTAR
ncbi:acyl-CoA-binding domain-containing protein 5-like isoform X1 [Pomacea canaliculata]|uniref:acyl-CoA-binding domain-containing protein 5-like isoform X1 n=1 Tax=Pomacea canaliculata TaxID=400727 RepID=UPI000D736659|nr:acyl-CoA-binding domain-containing protein 5-like isoform X1 [Pomacea canaliculata]